MDRTTRPQRTLPHRAALLVLLLLATVLLGAVPAHAAPGSLTDDPLPPPPPAPIDDLVAPGELPPPPPAPIDDLVAPGELPPPDDIDDLVAPPLPPEPPVGPDDLELPPLPEPVTTIGVDPGCDADGTIAYDIDIAPEPAGPLGYEVQWRVPGGSLQTVDGEDGVIPTGEGTFEVRGRVHIPGPGYHASDFVEVTVACDDEPTGPDEESTEPIVEPPDEESTEPIVEPPDEVWPDAPRPGTPTFTG